MRFSEAAPDKTDECGKRGNDDFLQASMLAAGDGKAGEEAGGMLMETEAGNTRQIVNRR